MTVPQEILAAAMAPPQPDKRCQCLGLVPLPERRFIADVLRTETVGGILLLVATVAALVWANVWPDAYETVRHRAIGPSAPLRLNLQLEAWAMDGLPWQTPATSQRYADTPGDTPSEDPPGLVPD